MSSPVCRPNGHKSNMTSRTSPFYVDTPVVHARDRKSISQVVGRWIAIKKELGSNPSGVHLLVLLPTLADVTS